MSSLSISEWYAQQVESIRQTTSQKTLERVKAYEKVKQQLLLKSEQFAKWVCLFQLNTSICWQYYYLHQRYLLSPLIEECHFYLEQAEKYLDKDCCQLLVKCYQDLIEVYQCKNHLRGVVCCYQCICKITQMVGDNVTFVWALTLLNVYYGDIPCLKRLQQTKEQLLQSYPEQPLQEVIERYYQGRKGLKTDPIEQSDEYLAIYDEAEKLIQEQIERDGRLARVPEQYFTIKKRILRQRFGIEWRSPREINPKLRF